MLHKSSPVMRHDSTFNILLIQDAYRHDSYTFNHVLKAYRRTKIYIRSTDKRNFSIGLNSTFYFESFNESKMEFQAAEILHTVRNSLKMKFASFYFKNDIFKIINNYY